MTCRLGILVTHPIQYQVPWFRHLAQDPLLALKVLYCYLPDSTEQGRDFGVEFQWDVPLLEGYEYQVLENAARPPSSARFAGCDVPGIRRAVRSHGFDALLISGWQVKAYLQALWACWRLRVPTLVRGDSNAQRRRPWWARLVHRVLLRQFSAMLVVGRSNADFYRQYGIPPERMFPGPHFVENERFARRADALRPQRDQLRRRWGIGADKVVALFCGKLTPVKRAADFLHALGKAAAAGARLHALVVGDGILRSLCEELAQTHGWPATFAGFLNQSRVPEAYVAADLLVLPSDYETWGLVVNEAMACGLPAVVSDRVGCGLDLVIEGRTGRVFPFGDVAALARCLQELAHDRERIGRMGAAAREHVAGYSMEAATHGLHQALRYVCPERLSGK